MAELLTRIEPIDTLSSDNEMLILTDSKCLRLTDIAATLFQHLEQPRPFEELCELLESEFGPAPSGTHKAVTLMLDELRRAGLVA